ncbi:hypothetical protein PsorP6_006378 [Peronosclerospora sorghi]|uniref:Uncharacterized protein n=1 Tax=Peronosclerospora sorghi TaxID=230839 RepID=A0ACC0W316_9STRA|nr:hypothetical protein PsorP6_006378 [Peronosclerospora sorghi]
MESASNARMIQLSAFVTGRRYLMLTAAATAVLSVGSMQRLRALLVSDALSWTFTRLLAELFTTRISAMITLHFFVVVMYHACVCLASAMLGVLRPTELQQTKETLIPFVLLRCQLLVSTMEPFAQGWSGTEIGLLVVWLAALAALRALVALAHARFQHVLTKPRTQVHDLQRIGTLLGLVFVLNFAMAATCSRLHLFSERIMYIPWFEASLMVLKTLELGVQVGFHNLDFSEANSLEDDEASTGCWENSEFHLLLLQTALYGCYLVQLVVYYLYVISVDKFRVSLFDLILILNVKNSTVRLLKKLKHVKLYHQVVLDLDHLFPDATPEELHSAADDVCVICLQFMPTQAKKLRCGHLFHRLCLRQCLQKASNSEFLAGLDPLTRMANGLEMESPLPVGGNSFSNSTSMRCPICRMHVCGEKSDEASPEQLEEHLYQPEAVAAGSREAGQQQQVAVTSNTQVEAREQATVDANGNAASEEVLRFSTAFLSRYVPFPNFSFEIVRHRNFEVTQEMLQQIWEVFPQYTREEIRADLARTQSVERTMERILSGRLDEQRVANGGFVDAALEPGDDLRWGLTTLASALSEARNVPTPASVLASTPNETYAGRPDTRNGNGELPEEEVSDLLLRRLQRWSSRGPE